MPKNRFFMIFRQKSWYQASHIARLHNNDKFDLIANTLIFFLMKSWQNYKTDRLACWAFRVETECHFWRELNPRVNTEFRDIVIWHQSWRTSYNLEMTRDALNQAKSACQIELNSVHVIREYLSRYRKYFRFSLAI